jgi:hypothetical protein
MLFGTSSLHQLDKSVASLNGRTAVPSTILGQAHQMESATNDGESLDGPLTCTTNSTTSGRRSSLIFSESIKTLGEKGA